MEDAPKPLRETELLELGELLDLAELLELTELLELVAVLLTTLVLPTALLPWRGSAVVPTACRRASELL